MSTPQDILGFWLDEVPQSAWYAVDPALDENIRHRFATAWENLMLGSYSLWLTYPSGTLAYIVLADQFSRNMFRGQGKAFASDQMGLAAAKAAIARGWDQKIDAPARQFFYLPLMHSENRSDQDRAVRLIMTRMPESGGSNLLHARAHREVIRQFGRFPYRNPALGRKNTAQETAYLAQGGYAFTLRSLEEEEKE